MFRLQINAISVAAGNNLAMLYFEVGRRYFVGPPYFRHFVSDTADYAFMRLDLKPSGI